MEVKSIIGINGDAQEDGNIYHYLHILNMWCPEKY
jgi:hypothetical protein